MPKKHFGQIRRLLRGLILWLVLSIAGGVAHSANVLPDQGAFSLTNDWALLLDPDEVISAIDLENPLVTERFSPRQGPIALGYIHGAAWLRFTVTRPVTSAPQWWLDLESPILDEAILYFPQGDHNFHVSSAGDRVPLANREIDHRSPTFRINLPEEKPVTFYVRVKGYNALSFSALMRSPDAFITYESIEQLWFGFFLAIHLVLFITNLWFFQATRDPAYGWFSLFTVANFLNALSTLGYAYRYLLKDMPLTNEATLLASWSLAAPTAAMFVLSYLNALTPPWSRMLKVSIGAVWLQPIIFLSLCGFTSWLWPRPAHMLWQMGVAGALMVVVIKRCLKGENRAQLLLLALAPLSVTPLMRFARSTGLLDAELFSDNTYALGMTFYLFVMNYALSRNYLQLRQEKERLQAISLEVAHRSELELEERVTQRTRELHESMQKVQASLDLERQAQAEQDVFLATISHELRTPLAIIDATAQNLELDADQVDEGTRARYAKILRATNRLSAVMENFLDEGYFTLLRRGIHQQACNLRELLEKTADSASLLGTQHQFILDTSRLPESFICDPHLTRLALMNLADNAVKYTAPGTFIILRGKLLGRRETDSVLLQVSDSGEGIPEEEAARIFEPRFRGSNAQEKPGTGMGLSLAQRMITMQNGTLTLRKSDEGGCCFSIVLPGHAAPDMDQDNPSLQRRELDGGIEVAGACDNNTG